MTNTEEYRVAFIGALVKIIARDIGLKANAASMPRICANSYIDFLWYIAHATPEQRKAADSEAGDLKNETT